MNSDRWHTLVNMAHDLLHVIDHEDKTGTRTKLTELAEHVDRYLPKPEREPPNARAKAPDYFCVNGYCGLGRHVSSLEPLEEDIDYEPHIYRVPMSYAGTPGGTQGFTNKEEAAAFYAAVKDAMEHAP